MSGSPPDGPDEAVSAVNLSGSQTLFHFLIMKPGHANAAASGAVHRGN